MFYRRKILFIILLLGLIFSLITEDPAPVQAATINVDGTTCTLTDAILAANTGGTVGGCTGSGGADTIILDTDVTLTTADTVNSTQLVNIFAGLPDVTSDITIQAGTGSIIERDSGLGCVKADPNSFRILNITGAGALTLDGIIVQNGCSAPNQQVNSQGGAIYVGNGTILSLFNSEFNNNKALGDDMHAQPISLGGAIYLNTATLQIVDNTIFMNNSVQGGARLSGTGGGGVAEGGAIAISGNAPNILNSIFANNSAIGGVSTGFGGYSYGGAIVILNAASSIGNISNNRFLNNTAQAGDGQTVASFGLGGAIGFVQSSPVASINNNTFIDNTAQAGNSVTSVGEGRGGALYGPADITDLENNTFADNTAVGGNNTGVGSGAFGRGGALYISGTITNFTHNTISGNHAIGGTGAGGNAGAFGGGFYNDGFTLNINNNIFANNDVTPGGGATNPNDCFSTGSFGSTGYNLMATAEATCPLGSIGDQPGIDAELNSLANNGCTTTLPDGSCVQTMTLFNLSPALDSGSCTVSGATTDQRDIARPIDIPSVVDVDDGCDIGAVEMQSSSVPALIIVDGTTCTLSDAILAANAGLTVNGCVGSNLADTIRLNADVTLTVADTVNSTEINNSYAGLPDITSDITINAGIGTVIERDGGLGCVDSDPNEFRIFHLTGSGALTLDGITLQNACANGRGGAILTSDTSSLTIQNSTLTNNQVVSDTDQIGGAVLYFWSSGSLNITNSTISNNITTADTARGGALFIVGGTVAIDGNIFTNNQAIGIDNNAGFGGWAQGGAMELTSGINSISSISDNIFTGNIAHGGDGSVSGGDADAGAIYKNESSPIVQNMSNNIFDGNQAIGGNGGTGNGGRATGGASNLRFQTGSTLFDNNQFINNLAQGGDSSSADGGDAEGGAINTVASGSSSTISNLSFINNTARGGDGAINGGDADGGATEGYFHFENSTFSGNLAQGGNGTSGNGGNARGGAWFVDDDAEPHHVTIANNQVIAGTGGTTNGVAEGGGIYHDGSYGFFFSNSIIADNTATPAGGSPMANDCDWGVDSYDESSGYNIIEAPGSCVFTFDPTDITGVDPLLGTLADNGCTTTLPDSSCNETIALLEISEAIDGGSCTVSGATVDQVGTARPQAIGGLPDADDSCDVGAFEYVGSDYVNDAIVLFDPSNSDTGFFDSVLNSPNEVTYTNTPPTSANAEWVMGDWNGDGVKTPGIFDNGAFRYTNFDGASTNWSTGFWLGNAPGRAGIVTGRFDTGFANDNGNDCIGWVDSNTNGAGDLRFSLKYWCDMTTTPQSIGGTLTPQWLAAPLSDSQGFSGTHQWVYGDWDNDNLDEPAVRRGQYITRSTNAPSEGAALYGAGMAQRWAGTGGATGPGGHGLDEGVFVAGDWNGDGTDTWGVVYDDDIFYYRDVFGFNPGPWEFGSQTFTSSISAPRQVDSHHLANGGSSSPAPALADGLVANESGGTVDTSRNVEADLSVSKAGNYQIGEVGLVGDSIVWTITVSNTGTAPANGVQITDNVPAELRVDNALADNGTISVRGQIVTFTAESIGVGETVQFQVVTTILSEPNSGQFANSVNVLIPDGDGSGSDTNLVASGTVESVDNLPATGYAPNLRW